MKLGLGLGLVGATMLVAASSAASAMPIAPAPQVSNIEQVRLVCDAWGRCWRSPNYYYGGPAYYAPRYYGPRYYGGYRGYGGYGRWGHRW